MSDLLPDRLEPMSRVTDLDRHQQASQEPDSRSRRRPPSPAAAPAETEVEETADKQPHKLDRMA